MCSYGYDDSCDFDTRALWNGRKLCQYIDGVFWREGRKTFQRRGLARKKNNFQKYTTNLTSR